MVIKHDDIKTFFLLQRKNFVKREEKTLMRNNLEECQNKLNYIPLFINCHHNSSLFSHHRKLPLSSESFREMGKSKSNRHDFPCRGVQAQRSQLHLTAGGKHKRENQMRLFFFIEIIQVRRVNKYRKNIRYFKFYYLQRVS